ncbi:MAG: cytochrome c oxidase assembly protein [Chloroflexi bacterium]|nr:cytochrome c oxidase assembly protein [Chloroflexota bacterium]MBV9597562.1 cytochrome c oxidase assembly protein [Chloroflexota bacterium]
MDLTAWSWDPFVLLGVALAAVLYARGWRYLRRRGSQRATTGAAVCFGVGLVLILLALVSPIGTYDSDLFSLHMTEHLLLTAGAAPLLLLGRPLVPLLWGLPDQERRGASRLLRPRGTLFRVGSGLARPSVAVTLFVTSFALWHVPFMYDAAQGQSVVHYAEHTLFFLTALLFWWPVIHPGGGRRTLGKIAAIGYVSIPMLEGTLIGALLTFAQRPFYATYLVAPRLTGLSPLDDQQLAGLIMWIPGGMVYGAAILWLLAGVLRDEEAAEAAQLPSAAPLTAAERSVLR